MAPKEFERRVEEFVRRIKEDADRRMLEALGGEHVNAWNGTTSDGARWHDGGWNLHPAQQRVVDYLLRQHCAACGHAVDPARRGVISFGNSLHEHHCMACCLAWERILIDDKARGLFVTLVGFRVWQADRRRAAT